MKEEELLNLIDKINTEKCIVILGPHLATKDEGSILTELNTKLSDVDKVTYYKDEDVLGIAAKTRNNFLQPKINAFFDEYQPNEVYELLSEIPFSLVINTAPDKFLLKAMKDKGISPSYSYYHKGLPVENYEHNFEKAEESEDRITTHIYNIFGDYNFHGSLVLTFKDMYEYLYSIMQKDNLDVELRTKIHDAETVLFFGCSFDRWYFQLFFQLFLQIMDFDDDSDILNSNNLDPKKLNTKNFIMNEFSMDFFEDDASKAIKVLNEAVKSGKISWEKEDAFDGPPPKVFISYKWGGESEKLANELKDTLTEKKIVVKIDKEELPYKGNIEEFEKHIGQADGILVVVSHAYLESEHCMYELSEIFNNGNFVERIFPLILSDAKTFKSTDLGIYKDFWNEKIKDIGKEIAKDPGKAGTFMDDINKYNQILKDFDDITGVLKKSNLGDVDEHRKTKFDVISKQIIKSHRALLRMAE
ncbi:SIR2-like domain-containing protein [Pricia antarctica]|uniref:SIR2-like domain-containing protein n=1 Tax=Pricia antarctica TaxID=641691 RepID=A0A1G7E6U5_9FLAO|nr:toll/interleukin-1 receptor domain-containing protein [Pricia antarctica]SDE59353.1 SIR2-like domain-containing protein [Pricia antarctica]